MITQFIIAAMILSLLSCGRPGTPGEAGTQCVSKEAMGGVLIECGETKSFIPYPDDGIPGQTGPAGRDGTDGQDGTDGVDGKDGADGSNGLDAILEVITPCPDRPGFAEVLLRLPDGQLLAHYSHDNRQFFILVTPGTWQTTDDRHCVFTVDDDYTVTDADGNVWTK